MKDRARVLGIDDAPFIFADEKVPIIGALLRPPGYLEAVMRSEVEVDGTDATDSIISMVCHSRYREQIKLIMIDGIALGGFNLVDISAIHNSLQIPVATVTRDRPDIPSLQAALEKHFEDWRVRMDVVRRLPLQAVETVHSPIYVSFVGLKFEELIAIMRSNTIQGALPEPLRVAHLIATAMARGESYGRA